MLLLARASLNIYVVQFRGSYVSAALSLLDALLRSTRSYRERAQFPNKCRDSVLEMLPSLHSLLEATDLRPLWKVGATPHSNTPFFRHTQMDF